jgi:hypothetical protein
MPTVSFSLVGILTVSYLCVSIQVVVSRSSLLCSAPTSACRVQCRVPSDRPRYDMCRAVTGLSKSRGRSSPAAGGHATRGTWGTATGRGSHGATPPCTYSYTGVNILCISTLTWLHHIGLILPCFISQVNSVAVCLRRALGAVFDVHRRPSHAGNKYKAWGPVEKRYLGNCNGFRYSVQKVHRDSDPQKKDVKRPVS